MVMTGTKITMNERSAPALFGMLGNEHNNFKDRIVNDRNMILLVAKMCISEVKINLVKHEASRQYSR